MPASMDHSEILDLSIAYLNDVVTIFRCCLASKHQNSACRAHVQQHLPSLLRSAHQGIVRDCCERRLVDENVHVKPLEWLYRTAGRTIVSLPATASALLCLGEGFSSMPYEFSSKLISVAIQHGVQLTLETLVVACKARADVDIWFDQFFPGCDYGGGAWQLPDNLALPEVVVAVYYDNREVLKRLLPNVTREQMPDVLLVAVNRCSYNNIMALEALLEHDRLHTQLLHPVSSCSSTGGAGSDDCPITLVQQLLINSIVCGKQVDVVVSRLVATPAAQALDAATVLKLLYLEVQHGGADDFCPFEDTEGSVMAALCSLPAVRQPSAAQICNLLHYAMMTQHCGRFKVLLALPQAQQLPSKQLFDMLLVAASRAAKERELFGLVGHTSRVTEHRALLCELAALDSAKQLESGDAFKLLEAALQDPWTPEMDMFKVLQQDLDAMELGSQLTGSELLQLMMMSVEGGSGDCYALAELIPAASLIDDAASYVAFLEKAIDAGCTDDVIEHTATKIDLTMRLGPDSVLRLLQKSVSSGYGVCDFILLIPALQQIPTSAAGQLLLQAAKGGLLHQMQKVLGIPAVAALSPVLLEELLQVILAQGSVSLGCNSADTIVVPELLNLPAAGQLTAQSLTQAFLQVIGWHVTAREHLQRGEYSTQRVHQQLAATADVTQALLQLMDAVALPESALVQLLQAAMAADDSMSLERICRLSAVKQLSDASAQLVYESALEAGNKSMLQQLQEWVPQVAVAAGTFQLTGAQLQKQIASALARQQLQTAIDLCQHPAAAQINPADMQQLLQTAIQLPMCNTASSGTSSTQTLDVVSSMVSMQVAQVLGPSAVAELLGCCLKQQYEAGVKVIATLPATAQLTPQQSESLLRHALDVIVSSNNSAGSWKALEGLVQLRIIQTLPAQAVLPLILSGVKHGVQLPNLKLLVHELMAVQALSADNLRMLLLAAVETQDARTFSWLRSFPAAPDDEEVQAWATVVDLSA